MVSMQPRRGVWFPKSRSSRRRTDHRHEQKHKLSCWEPLEDRRLLAVITVNTLLDEADGSLVDGDVSLRDAISLAASGDTIDFAAVLDGGTVPLTLGQLVVAQSLAIDASALAAGITIDGQNNSRVLEVRDDIGNQTVELRGLTLTGGNAMQGGAIRNVERLTVFSSTITGNNAALGGAIFDIGDGLTVSDSTISGNSANSGAGIFSDSPLPLRVTNSTISGNVANADGGGIHGVGANVIVSNSTISDNSAGSDGGGIFARLGGTITVSASTITGNAAAHADGISTADATILIENSIVAGNVGTTQDIECGERGTYGPLQPDWQQHGDVVGCGSRRRARYPR